MSGESPAENAKGRESLLEFSGLTKVLAVLVICAFGVLLLGSLSVTDFQSTHEGRVVDVARNMLASGEFWVPTLNGVPRLEKSPLVYWIVAGSGKVWGELNEFSARLPSVMVGLGCVLVTILIGRSMFNSTVGLIAGLVHISTFVYWRDCRTAELDIYLTFFMSLGMLAFCRLLFNNSKKTGWFWVLLFWVSMGCAAASKSILAVLPGLAVCGLGLLLCGSKNNGQKQTAGRLWWWNTIGVVLFLAIGAGWNVGMLLKFPELAEGLWNREISEILLNADSSRPMRFYLTRIFVWAFPASAFVPGALLVIFSARFRQYRKRILFLLLWVVVVVGAYSIWPWGKKKLEYILPMIFAFSLLSGLLWNELLSKQRQGTLNAGNRITLLFHSLLFVACGLIALGFCIVDAENRWVVSIIGGALIFLGVFTLVVKTSRVPTLLWGTVLAMLAAMIINVIWFLPVINQQMSPRMIAEAVAIYGGKEGKVVLYSPGCRSKSPSKRKEQGVPSLNFYLKYDLRYLYSVAEVNEFLEDQPRGLIITLANNETEADLKKLGLTVLYRRDIHRPHLELTTKRLPKNWQEPIGELLAEYSQKPMKYTLLAGKEKSKIKKQISKK